MQFKTLSFCAVKTIGQLKAVCKNKGIEVKGDKRLRRTYMVAIDQSGILEEAATPVGNIKPGGTSQPVKKPKITMKRNLSDECLPFGLILLLFIQGVLAAGLILAVFFIKAGSALYKHAQSYGFNRKASNVFHNQTKVLLSC